MNLRPPGPQPERSRRTRCSSAGWSGLSCSELLSVALNLHPGLHPADTPWRDIGRPPPLTSAALAIAAATTRERSASGRGLDTRVASQASAVGRARKRLLLAKAVAELRPASDCSGCSHSSNPMASGASLKQRQTAGLVSEQQSPPALLLVVLSERPTRPAGDDRLHGKQQRCGRSASSVRTAQLHGTRSRGCAAFGADAGARRRGDRGFSGHPSPRRRSGPSDR